MGTERTVGDILADVVTNASDCIFAVDRDLRIVYANPAAARALQLAGHSDGAQRPALDSAHADAAFTELVLQALRRGHAAHGDAHLGERTFELAVTPVLGGDQEVELLVVFGRDVHDRREAETLLGLASSRAQRSLRLVDALARARTSDDVARSVAEHGLSLLDADAGALYVTSVDGNELILATYRALGAPLVPPQRLPLTQAEPVCVAITTGVPVWLERPDEAAASYPAAFYRGAQACVPLRVHDQILGGLVLTFADRRALDPDERSFLLGVANKCALALGRVSLQHAADASFRRQQLIADAARDFSEATLDYDRLLEIVAQHGARALQSGSVVMLLSDDTQTLRCAAGSHDDPDLSRDLTDALEREPPAADVGLAGAVIASGEPRLLNDLSRAEVLAVVNPTLEHLVRRYEPRHFAAAPLYAGRRVTGVLVVVRLSGAPPYDNDDLRLLVDLAERAALAIDSARQHALLRTAHEALLASQHRLRDSEDRLREALEAAGNIGVWRMDLDQRTLQRDANMNRIIGLAPQESTVPLADFEARVHPDDRARVAREVEDAVRERRPYRTEARMLRADGVVRWFRDQGRVRTNNLGEPTHMTGVATDITERKETEEALAAADRRKDEFIATLAHELRNPLAAISLAAELQRQNEASVTLSRQAREIIERQAASLGRLVDDLLDVARITRGKLELRKERVRIDAVISRAVDAVRLLAVQARVELAVRLPERALDVFGDSVRLEQVVVNLLSNALKYTQVGGAIRVDVVRDGGHVHIVVEDNGTGIEPALLPKIFEPFQQADTTLARTKGGLGIGLSIVRGLVALHEGVVTATSEGIGRGSTFTVRLPLLESAISRRAAPREPDPGYANTPVRVLLAEDNDDVRLMLRDLLEASGCRVLAVADGLEAVTAAAAFGPRVCVVDIGLPSLDGYEVARRLRALLGPELILVAVTGYGQERDRQRAFDAGFDHHMKKPISADDLRELIARATSRTQRAAALN